MTSVHQSVTFLFSISKPEQVTLGLQRESKKWSEIVHKYSVKNQGPSPLEDKDIKVYVPAIVHRQEDLIADTYVEVTCYRVYMLICEYLFL